MSTDQDEIPIRLPSGSKAVVILPRPFTPDDAKHLIRFLEAYVEEAIQPSTQEVSKEASE